MKLTRNLSTLIITVLTVNSCATGKKNRFPEGEGFLSEPSSYIYPAAESAHTQKRKPTSVEENIFKLFAKNFSEFIRGAKAAKKEIAPTLEAVDKAVAREAKEHIPALMDKEFKNTTELYEDVKKFKNADQVQMDALNHSIRPLTQEFGVEAGATVNALKQTAQEAKLKNMLPNKTIPRFDLKNTENAAGTVINEMKAQSASGDVYTFLIDGKAGEVIKGMDTDGKVMFIKRTKLFSKDGILSGYDYGFTLRKSELEMDFNTKKAFSDYLKTYRTNHPEANISADVEIFRTQAGIKKQLMVFDSFLKVQMSKGKRVAMVMEDAESFLGDIQKGGSLDDEAKDVVQKWMTRNPALDADGNFIKADGKEAYFTNIILAEDGTKLHPSLITNINLGKVKVPHPSYQDGFEFVNQLFENPKYENVLSPGFTREDFTRTSGSLTLAERERMVRDFAERNKQITPKDVQQKVIESLDKKFSEFANGTKKVFRFRVPEKTGGFNTVLLANKRQIEYIKAKRDYFKLHGALDDKHSTGMIFLGPTGVGKTTIAEATAEMDNAILATMDEYATEYHGSAPAMAGRADDAVRNGYNMRWFFDEIDGMPSVSQNVKGQNAEIAKDGNAAATKYKQMFSGAPTKETDSFFLAATANIQLVGGEYLREGRFGVAVPLNMLSEVTDRREVIDQLFTKYKSFVGDVDSKVFSDELVERLPCKDDTELETLIKAAIMIKQNPSGAWTPENFRRAVDNFNISAADASAISPEHMERALELITFQRKVSLQDYRTAEFGKAFYCSDDAFYLLPEYFKRIPPDEFAKAKEAYQLHGIEPDWQMPTWLTGNGRKPKPIQPVSEPKAATKTKKTKN